MVRTLASEELSTSVTWPEPSRSSSSTSLRPSCHLGAETTSSTTFHTSSMGASISAVEDPEIAMRERYRGSGGTGGRLGGAEGGLQSRAQRGRLARRDDALQAELGCLGRAAVGV